MKDLRYALRMLAKSPMFTVIAVLTLAVGIGSATVVFSAFNAFFLKPLPLMKNVDRLLFVTETDLEGHHDTRGLSYLDFCELKAHLTTTEGIWVFGDMTVILGGPGEPQRLLGTEISWDAFDQLGVHPILGRNFRPEEDQAASPGVALLSYELWEHRYGKKPEVIGSTIMANGETTTVVGVMPKGWGYPEMTEIWTPLRCESERMTTRGDYHFNAHAKLKPGATVGQFRSEAEAIVTSLNRQYKPKDEKISLNCEPLREHVIRDSARSIRLLFGAVLFVFLIACLNVANLLLARGSARSKEVAIRLALGAARSRLIRQFLTESLVLAFLGGMAGFIFALWGVDLMTAIIPAGLRFWLHFEADGQVFLFVTALSLLSAGIFGLVPALKATNIKLVCQLKEGGRTSENSGTANNRLRSTLVVVEVALALVLLVGAGLLLRSFFNLRNADPGFVRQNVLTFRTGIPRSMTTGLDERHVRFFHEVETRLAALPGVAAVGATSNYLANQVDHLVPVIFDGGFSSVSLPAAPISSIDTVSPGYFHTLGIPLVAGRWFNDADGMTAPPVAIVDTTFATAYLGGPATAVGQRFRMESAPGETAPWFEIIGVVGNVEFKPDAKRKYPAFYRPYQQEKTDYMTLVMRTAGDPLGYAKRVGEEVLAVNGRIPIYHTFSLDDILLRHVWVARFFSYLFTASGLIALFLACIGLYGVMTFNVSQRQQELGMRMALGAQPQDVIQMVLRRGMILVLAGLGFGLVGAFLIVPLLAGTLYGVSPHDLPTFALVPSLLIGVALLACYLPSRRITLIDPNAALRYE